MSGGSVHMFFSAAVTSGPHTRGGVTVDIPVVYIDIGHVLDVDDSDKSLVSLPPDVLWLDEESAPRLGHDARTRLQEAALHLPHPAAVALADLSSVVDLGIFSPVYEGTPSLLVPWSPIGDIPIVTACRFTNPTGRRLLVQALICTDILMKAGAALCVTVPIGPVDRCFTSDTCTVVDVSCADPDIPRVHWALRLPEIFITVKIKTPDGTPERTCGISGRESAQSSLLASALSHSLTLLRSKSEETAHVDENALAASIAAGEGYYMKMKPWNKEMDM